MKANLIGDLGSNVEALCSDCSQELPGVAPGVPVIGIATDENPGLAIAVGFLIDWVFFAESFDKIPVFNN